MSVVLDLSRPLGASGYQAFLIKGRRSSYATKEAAAIMPPAHQSEYPVQGWQVFHCPAPGLLAVSGCSDTKILGYQ